MARRILVLFAHPAQPASEINVRLARAAEGVEGVTLIDLYALYPRYKIDVDAEQARLRDHDAVVFLHPLFWYSTPAILKEWQDLVLEHGFAYGQDGRALEGKLFFCACTAGGPEAAYREDGYNQFEIRTLFAPLEQMATLTRMTYLPPFVLFGARTAGDEHRIGAHLERWQTLLTALRDDTLDIAAAQAAPTLNDALGSRLEPV